MDKDRIKGKVKDVQGRIERQAGEWTGDKKKQVRGVGKQVVGKAQVAWGKVKDATRATLKEGKDPSELEDSEDTQDVDPETGSPRR